jgi:sigma-B regulation protein RsbU (phosphoserine phosphatase)
VTPRTLIADDQPDVLEALRMLLRREGHEIETALSPAAVLDALASRDFDLLLMDLNYARDTTSGGEGLQLLRDVRAMDEQLPIVVMTAWGNTNLAVEAMRSGACDYVEKPWDNQRLLAKLAEPLAKSNGTGSPHTTAGELIEARSIQRELLVHEMPTFQGLDIAVEWQPAGALSGDVYEVMKFPDGRGAAMIADAIGKGMPAALLASNLQATVRSLSRGASGPRRIMAGANESVQGRLEHGRFVTMFYVRFDPTDLRLQYASAGHPAGLLLRSGGALERLEEGGPVLGEFPSPSFEEGQMQLAEGDRLVLYTDGISEARSKAGEEFGEAGILRVARESTRLDSQQFSRRLVKEAQRHCGGRLKDDATAVVLTVRGA